MLESQPAKSKVVRASRPCVQCQQIQCLTPADPCLSQLAQSSHTALPIGSCSPRVATHTIISVACTMQPVRETVRPMLTSCYIAFLTTSTCHQCSQPATTANPMRQLTAPSLTAVTAVTTPSDAAPRATHVTRSTSLTAEIPAVADDVHPFHATHRLHESVDDSSELSCAKPDDCCLTLRVML